MAKRISAAKFVAFLEKRLAAKDGYIFGAVGQDPRKLSSWYFTGQYGGRQLEKALYWRAHAERVWDCNGLAEGYYRGVTGVDINARARDNYRHWCNPRGEGTIPAAYRVPGAAVFKRSNEIHHVGFLERPVDKRKPKGDWYVIEARGVMYGVIRSRLSENDWNCWGLMTKYFDYGKRNADPGVQKWRALKPGSRGEDVRELQEALILLGFALPESGADGEYGAETEAAVRRFQSEQGLAADGVCGRATRAALAEAREREALRGDAGAEDEFARVRVTAETAAFVRGGPGTAYEALTTVHPGERYDSPSVAANGWRCIRVEGRLGWISPRMCEVIADG